MWVFSGIGRFWPLFRSKGEKIEVFFYVEMGGSWSKIFGACLADIILNTEVLRYLFPG